MRIVAISDTHNKLDQIKIPEGDVLVHAGDFTAKGRPEELELFNEHLGDLDFSHTICTPGNHDFLFERDEKKARDIVSNATILIDEEIVVDGVKFYGSPWQPVFYNWAFNLPRGKHLKEKWDLIPEDTDVLITHTPPHTILDMVYKPFSFHTENVGCEELHKRVLHLSLKAHVMGHIHCSYGMKLGHIYADDKMSVNLDTLFINAACLDDSYMPTNKPIVFDL